MLVEFSPWETTDSSLHLTMSRRKRSRRATIENSHSNQICDEEAVDPFIPLVGSVVTLTKSHRKKNRLGVSDESRARYAVASSHRVNILLQKEIDPKNSTQSSEAEFLMEESSWLQYTSRPGDEAAFFSDGSRRGKQNGSPCLTSKIPVIFDAKNERLFAFQGGNKELVFWDVRSEGPDQGNNRCRRDSPLSEPDARADPVLSFDLPSRAVSLSLLPHHGSGIVVGSLESGALFYANVDRSNSTMQVHFLSSKLAKDEGHSKNNNTPFCVGMLITAKDEDARKSNGNGRLSSSKQKATKGRSDTQFSFQAMQFFVHDCDATIKCHDLVVFEEEESKAPTVKHQKNKTASISLLPPGMTEMSPSSVLVEGATLLPTTVGKPETATLYFRLSRKSKDASKSKASSKAPREQLSNERYCCTIRLSTGHPIHPPFAVSSSPDRLALLNPRLLAIGNEEQIQVCDSFNGVVLHSEPLPTSITGAGADWVLSADSRIGHLLILCADPTGTLTLTSAFLNLESEGEDSTVTNMMVQSEISLAERLSAAIVPGEHQKWRFRAPKLFNFPEGATTVVQPVSWEDEVARAIELLQDKVAAIMREKGRGYKAGALVETYRSASLPLLYLAKNLGQVVGEHMEASGGLLETSHPNYGGPVIGIHAEENGGRPSIAASSLKKGVKIAPAQCNRRGAHGVPCHADAKDEAARRTLPLSFIDAVIPNVLRLLLQVKSSYDMRQELSYSIGHDCCLLLRNLLASGKVSARRHFGDKRKSNDFFTELLQCMRVEQTHEIRLFSPIDFIDLVLSHCDDISESQLVAMLSYMFRSSRPADIAFAFLDSDYLCPNHYCKTLSRRFTRLTGHKSGKPSYASNEVQEIGSKLLIAGSAALFKSILLYSHCNQALLRAALRQKLLFGCETGLLSRLLAELALARSRPSLSASKASVNKSNIVVSVAQWIPALFDAFSDEIRNEENTSSFYRDLLRLRQRMRKTRRQTELLLSLEDDIKVASLGSGMVEAETRRKRRKTTKSDEEGLPACSLERLFF